MTTAHHTPTPYEVAAPTKPITHEESLDFGIVAVVNGERKIIAEVWGKVGHGNFPPARSTAEFIVIACNSNDALVEALSSIVGAVSSEHWDKPSYMIPFIKVAASALALAERSEP